MTKLSKQKNLEIGEYYDQNLKELGEKTKKFLEEGKTFKYPSEKFLEKWRTKMRKIFSSLKEKEKEKEFEPSEKWKFPETGFIPKYRTPKRIFKDEGISDSTKKVEGG